MGIASLYGGTTFRLLNLVELLRQLALSAADGFDVLRFLKGVH